LTPTALLALILRWLRRSGPADEALQLGRVAADQLDVIEAPTRLVHERASRCSIDRLPDLLCCEAFTHPCGDLAAAIRAQLRVGVPTLLLPVGEQLVDLARVELAVSLGASRW
jgi:hypothetical protein